VLGIGIASRVVDSQGWHPLLFLEPLASSIGSTVQLAKGIAEGARVLAPVNFTLVIVHVVDVIIIVVEQVEICARCKQ